MEQTSLKTLLMLGGSGGGGGGINYFKYMYGLQNLFREAVFPFDSLVCDFEGGTISGGVQYILYKVTTLKAVTFKNVTMSSQAFNSAFSDMSNVETITFENATISPNNSNAMFRYCGKLTAIYGEMDMQYCTNNGNMFGNCPLLEHVELKQDSVKINIDFSVCPLDDASLVSVGNSLDGTQTGKTITLSAGSKTRCDALMGTNNNGTFVADAQGATSLSAFITTVKGWAIA